MARRGWLTTLVAVVGCLALASSAHAGCGDYLAMPSHDSTPAKPCHGPSCSGAPKSSATLAGVAVAAPTVRETARPVEVLAGPQNQPARLSPSVAAWRLPADPCLSSLFRPPRSVLA